MAKRRSTAPHPYVTFFQKPRKNRDGSRSILTMVRVPKFKRFSKSFKTQEEAEAWAFPLMKELSEQGKRGARPGLPTLTITHLINQYLDDPKTEELTSYEDYAHRANWWKVNYGWVKVLDFDVPLLYEARNKLRTTGRFKVRSAGTVNRHLAIMRLIWNWGRSSGWLPQDRHWPTKLHMKEPRSRVRFLSTEERKRLFDAADADPIMRAAILVSIAAGLRQSELLRLKWTDVDFTNSRVTIHKAKNDTPRQIHLTAQAVAALKKLDAGNSIWVFTLDAGERLDRTELIRRWRLIRAAAALVNFKWHDLRHTHASYLAQNGATLLEIGSTLGHKSQSVTMRYAHLVQGAPVTGHAALDEMLKGE